MIISFAGHSFVSSPDRVREILREKIREQIIAADKITFYLGGYGGFDELCASVCREVREEREGVELVYVTPYISLSEQEKIKGMLRAGQIDGSLYPPIEKTPLRFAIVKRNDWMMINADLIIAYVNHSYGGAYRSLQVARRKKKKIINVCDSL